MYTMDDNSKLILKRVTLTVDKFCEVMRINSPIIVPDVVLDYATKSMVIRLTGHLLTDRKPGRVFKAPTTPFQFMKEKYAPEWVLKRWPVKYKETKIDFVVMYPDYKLSPDQLGRRFIDVLETQTCY